MYITVNGKILPCERVGHHYSFGQIHSDHVELNEEYIAKTHNQYVSKFLQQCINCANNHNCPQCVYQIDDILKENIRCLDYLSANKSDKINKNTMGFLQANPHYYKRILDGNMFKFIG